MMEQCSKKNPNDYDCDVILERKRKLSFDRRNKMINTNTSPTSSGKSDTSSTTTTTTSEKIHKD